MISQLSFLGARLSGPAMVVLAVLVLGHLVLGIAAFALPSRIAAIVVLIAVLPRFQTREWLLLAVALGLSLGLIQREGGLDEVTMALGQGAYFCAFIMLMMLLREAAVTSNSVLAVGAWIAQQPPGRRFVATWVGGHTAGILMNFGAVSLLSPLIQRGVRAGPMETPEQIRRAGIRERRQLSALIRGFAWVICWAPTTLTQAIILTSVPGLDHGKVIAFGVAISAVMFCVGWLEDRLRWGKPRAVIDGGPAFPRRAALDLAAVYVLLVAGAWIVREASGLSTPKALMTVAPLMLIGWVFSQNIDPVHGVLHGALRCALQRAALRIGEIYSTAIPRMSKDAYVLGAAGFIGVTAAKLAPVAVIAAFTEEAHLPPWLLVASLPILITLGGQIALSPMMMVVFLAAVISALPTLPTEPEYIALALGTGWALSMTASPNATGALLIAGATGLPATTLTWRWNGLYSLIAITVLVALFWLIVP